MTTTWFDGSFDAFVESARRPGGKGSRSQHFLGGTVAEIEGTRAIAQTRHVDQRALAARRRRSRRGVHGPLLDRVEKREGVWRHRETLG